MFPDDSLTSAWGHLIPLKEGLPVFHLLEEESIVGTDQNSALHLEASALGVEATEVPDILFRLIRTESPFSVFLHSECDFLQVGLNVISCGKKERLQHGVRIFLGNSGAEFVFVDTVTSSFTAPSEVLDEYFLGHCLGQGGFGQVYLLFDKKSIDRRRAIKIVETSDDRKRQLAEREVDILKSLDHACVITTYSVHQWHNKQSLVMEYLPGGDLSVYVDHRRPRALSEYHTKLLFFQIALAVNYLHEKDICHRDLKPANILLKRLSPYTLIKVTDFGLAKDENASSLRTIAGTPNYIAPEMEDGQKYTNVVDVWSMGIMLFLSLTGSLPFSNATLLTRQFQGVREDCWGLVTTEAQELVQRMLTVDPEHRPSVSDVLGDLWFQDDTMRTDAYRLTQLENIRPQPRTDLLTDTAQV